MEIKKRILWLLLGFGCCFAACSSEDEDEQTMLPEVVPPSEVTPSDSLTKDTIPAVVINGLYFEKKQLELNHSSQNCKVIIRKNQIDHKLSILQGDNWLQLVNTRSLLEVQQSLSVQEHMGWTPREGRIVVHNDEFKLNDTLVVIQNPQKRIIIVPTEWSIEQESYSENCEVKHNVAIEVQTTPQSDWLTCSLQKVSDTVSTLQVKIDKNETFEQRAAVITVNAVNAAEGVAKHTIRVSQNGQTKPETDPGKNEELWVRGISIPQVWDTLVDSGVKLPFIPETEGTGWFDNNKLWTAYTATVDGEVRSINDRNHCWALTGANMVHWWIEQNRANIIRYEKKTGKEILKYITYDVKIQGSGLDEKSRSSLAQTIRESCTDKPFDPIYAVKWFISGRAIPNIQFATAKAPGWFADVFPQNSDAEINLCSYVSARNYKTTSATIKSYLKQNRVMALSHSLGRGSHVITVYGAEINAKGEVCAIYVADSDDRRHQIFKYGLVADASGQTQLLNTRTGEVMTNKQPLQLYYLDASEQVWSQFLANE